MLVERYDYDPYGKTYVEDINGNPRQISRYANPWMWTGQRFDGTTHQYHFTFRAYSPTTGRWLHRDPLGHWGSGVSLYEYTFSGPLYYVDPYGLYSWYEGWGDTLTIFFQLPTSNLGVSNAQDELAGYVIATTQNRQGYIDKIGYVPVAGFVADGTNALLYAAQGELGSAAGSGLGAIPGGDLLKGGNKAGKILGSVDDVGEGLTKGAARRSKNLSDDALEALEEAELKKLDDQLAKEANKGTKSKRKHRESEDAFEQEDALKDVQEAAAKKGTGQVESTGKTDQKVKQALEDSTDGCGGG